MKVTNDMIQKELRFRGKMFNLVGSNTTEKKFRLMQKYAGKFMNLLPAKDVVVEERWIPRIDGSRMKILILKPLVTKQNTTGILWMHGGGYAIGTARMVLMSRAKQLVIDSGAVVISPEYRLSVEAPYPAALHDCYDALLYMKNMAKELGINRDQLMIGGESAGGGLTAALSIYARDKKEVAIAFQMPLYPMLDDRMITHSVRDNNAPVWDSISNENAWKLYLGDLYGKEVPVYAAAAREIDYSHLPPAVTFVGDIEPFHDETVTYIANLRKAGVPADLEIYPGCFHSFDMLAPKAEVSIKAVVAFTKSYNYAVEHYFAQQET
jgi:acetyl esterase/lipase